MPEPGRFVEVSWSASGYEEIWIEGDQDPEDEFWVLVDQHMLNLDDAIRIDYINDPDDDVA